jgi:hypothetical protein
MRFSVTCLALSLVTLSLEGASANDFPSGHVGDLPVGIVVEDISTQEVGNHNIHADDLNYSAGEDYHPTIDLLGSDYAPMDTPYAEHRRTKRELNIWRTKAWTSPSNADVDMDTKQSNGTFSLSKSSSSGAVYSFTFTQSTLVSLHGSAYVDRGKAAVKNYQVSARGEVALELMTTLPGGNNSVSVQQRMEVKSEGSIAPVLSFDLGLAVGTGLSIGVPLYGPDSSLYGDFTMDDRGINRSEARGTGRPVSGEDETTSFRVYLFASATASATVTKPNLLVNDFDHTELWFDQWAKSRYTIRLGPLSQNHGPSSEHGGLPNLQELEAKGLQIGAYPLGRDEH